MPAIRAARVITLFRLVRLLALLTLLALLLAAAPVAAQTGSLTGTVTAASTALPIPAVDIYVYNASNTFVASGVTNGSGTYAVGGLSAGTYHVRTAVSSSHNFLDQIYSGLPCDSASCPVASGTAVTVVAGGVTSGINFSLSGGGAISGRITDAATLAGIGSTIVTACTAAASCLRNGTTLTDGTYQIVGLSPGNYYVRTSVWQNYVDELYNNSPCAPACTWANGISVPVTVGAVASNVNFELTAGATLTGTVRKASTLAPMSGVMVFAYTPTGAIAGIAATDADGAFTIDALATGTYYVKAVGQAGYVSELYDDRVCYACSVTDGTPITVTAGATTPNIDFTLEIGGAITGRVSDAATDVSLANVSVSVYSTAGVKLATAQTSGSGAYTFGSIAPGTYYLRAVPPSPYLSEAFDNLLCGAGCDPTSGTPIIVSGGNTTTGIDFALSVGGSVTGVVRDAGTLAGLASVSVQLYSDAGSFLKSGTTDANGAYSIGGLYPGTYFLRTLVATGSPYLDELYGGALCNYVCAADSGVPLTVSAAATTPGIDFDLSPGGVIAGTITDAVTAAPVASLSVTVYNAVGTSVRSVTTNTSGAYAIAGLPTGSYYVRTSQATGAYLDELYNDRPCPLAGCVIATGQAVTVTAGSTTANIDFALTQGGVISGAVTSASSGAPLIPIPVSLYNASGALVRTVNTGAGGVFAFGGLPSGAYYLRTSVQSFTNYIDEMYDNIPCFVSCNILTSTPVVATAGTTTSGVDFALSGGGTISGSVRAAATQALLSGSVALYGATGTTLKTASATNGVYTFTGLPAGTYYVGASRTGYLSERYDNVPCANCTTGGTPLTVAVGATVANVDFLLDVDPGADGGGGGTGASIAGVVVDAVTMAPLTNASVAATAEDGTGVRFAQTTDSGAYLLSGLSAGTYYIKASTSLNFIDEVYDNVTCAGCDARIGTPVTVSGSATLQGIDMALSRGGSISGTVTDASTLLPVPGVTVQAFTAQGVVAKSAVSGGDGSFFIRGLAAGNHFLRTGSPSGSGSPYPQKVYGTDCVGCPATEGTPVPVTPGTTTGGISIQVARGGSVSGTVSDETTGAGIPSVSITVQPASGSPRTVTTGADGAFAIVGLEPGNHFLRTSVGAAQNYLDELFSDIPCVPSCSMVTGTPVSVSAGNAANANFALARGGSVSGVVRDGATSAPIGGVTVSAYSSAGTLLRSGTSTAGGDYVVTGLPSGSYFLKTSAGSGYANQLYSGMPCAACDPLAGTAVPVMAGSATGNIDFNLTVGGSISGRVTDASTGVGIGSASVQVTDAQGRSVRSAQTLASGDYTVSGLPTGSYRASVTKAAYIGQVYSGATCDGSCTVADGTPIPVAAGASTPNVNFAITAAGSISGSVVDASTGFGASVSIRVYSAIGTLVKTQSVTGDYTVDGLPAGTYYVGTAQAFAGQTYVDEVYNDVACSGCDVTLGAPVVVTGATDTPNIDFALAQGGSLKGVVRDASTSAGLYAVPVTIYAGNGGVVRAVTTSALGSYAVNGLAPGSYYARTTLGAGSPYIDEVFSETMCVGCNPVLGTPIVVSAGNTTPDINFTLDPTWGAISGVVREASTNVPIASVPVTLYSSSGGVVRSATTAFNGAYTIGGLPAGTYYARTDAARDYVNRVYDDAGAPCLSDCDVLSGTPIVVASGIATNGIDFALPPNLARNLGFGAGTANWSLYATPSSSYLTSAVVNGVFEFTRVAPPPGTSNQAVIFQTTATPEASGTPLVAAFDLGNSSTVRKRISVLILDSNFSDLSVCTFWIPPNQTLKTYRMKTHTTKAWSNAAIYFYAATAGADGGSYRLDNVAFYADPTASATETRCEDPNAESLPGGVDSGTMLQNGDFGTGTLSPGWGTFGTITTQVTGGVLEFIRPTSVAPSGVVLQPTGQTLSPGQVLSAGFSLGNSSGVRKRVTVILHDNNFSDLAACTFWLPAGQALAPYSMKAYATKAWTNATLSVYPATTGLDQWIRLDDVSLVREATATIAGTECVEPGSAEPSRLAEGTPTPRYPGVDGGAGRSKERPDAAQGSPDPAEGGHYDSLDKWRFESSDGWSLRDDGALVLTARESGDATLSLREPIDLTDATEASLEFLSRLDAAASTGEVQVRAVDGAWVSVATLAAGSLEWHTVDLSAYAGELIEVRFVFHGVAGEPADTWEVSGVRVVR